MSPRGRNQTFRSLIEGTLQDPEAARQIIDTCLLCNECTSVCFSEVPTAHLMVLARNHLNDTQGIPKGLDFILRRLLPRPAFMRGVLRLAFIGKRLGISGLLRGLGILRQW